MIPRRRTPPLEVEYPRSAGRAAQLGLRYECLIQARDHAGEHVLNLVKVRAGEGKLRCSESALGEVHTACGDRVLRGQN